MKTLELLAPAKDYLSAVAAIDHGADAIYIGGSRFGARKAAGNSAEDIARVVEYAHQFGVKVYATFNILIFEEELEEARKAAMELVEAGVDALIIQDMAVARMGLPVELHASTQMCNMTAEGVKFLQDTGFERVVLERALSKKDIENIRSATTTELEAFIHGAICVGHSGRCYMSRSTSSRSGNRGECSQSCRMTYDLCSEDGEVLVGGKHLLSVKDMNMTHAIGEMIDAGVTSFKIEGRLKEIGYTKNIVAHYNRVLDQEIATREGYRRVASGESRVKFYPDPAKSFSRGETKYLFDGQRVGLASFDSPKSMGKLIGEVSQIRGRSLRINGLKAALTSGDGLCYMTRRGLRGTNLNHAQGEWIEPNSIEGVEVGTKIYRNFDKSFADALEQSRARRVIPATAEIEISEGCISLKYRDIDGFEAEATRELACEPTQNRDKMMATICAQLRKSGDTIFEVDEVKGGEAASRFFVPAKVLAELRREALEGLRNKRVESVKIGGRHFIENPNARYPTTKISSDIGVTNSLSKAFYMDHGVEEIEPSLELAESFSGARVMESSYCIRREIGECLKERPQLKGDLYLRHGADRFRVEFDCARCRMNIYKE